MNEIEQVAMNIIIGAGDCKALMYEALNKANENEFERASELIEEAEEALNLAHNTQTSLLQKEATGEKVEIGLLFVHAQDHLMTTISEKNLINEIIKLRKYISSIEK